MASLSPTGPSAADLSGGALAPQHYHPPTSRELRAQALHRLQIGVLGLASMLLLVTLASIIRERAGANEAQVAGPGVAITATADPDAAAANQAGDPLADMGVVPDLPAQGSPPSGAASGDAAAR